MTREEAIWRFENMAAFDDPDADPETVGLLKELANLSLQALREQEEREKQPQPLTMAELRNMNGETVYCLELNIEMMVLAEEFGWITVTPDRPLAYDRYKAHGLTLYRTRPEEDAK